ncbi:MAG: biotin synthase BioB [Planctomycetaceae bacterium]|nr:biotin synthase BioB [Planctomycetaceae bacterium]
MSHHSLKQATELPLDELLSVTSKLREQTFGNVVETCMIVNAKSGLCANNCDFCSQNTRHNSQIPAYPLYETQKLVEDAEAAADCGAMHFGIVTSGASVSPRELEVIADAVLIVSRSGRIKMCASLGKLDCDSLVRLKEAGLTRYHHNLETSESFYPAICTTQNWRERYETVRQTINAGLEVCSGALFGLGESWEDRADLAICLKELGVTSVPLNFLHAHPDTPMAHREPLSAEEALRIIALFRLLMPETSLRICGGRPKILADKQNMMFSAGANALMTGHYLTTSGVTPDTDRQMIENLKLVWA